MITFDDFSKLELRVGTILEAEGLPGSEKLIKLKVDLGPSGVIPSKEGIYTDNNKKDIRQILAGIKKWYTPAKLAGKQVVVVANLEPRIMMGFESQGMLLAADSGKPVLLKPFQKVPAGSKVR